MPSAEPVSSRPAQRPFLALALRLGSAASFATLLMLIKVGGQQGITLPEMMFWRQAGCLPLIAGWLALSGQLSVLKTRRMSAHGWRATIGMVAMMCSFGGAVLLPLAEATALGFTTALFAVLIAALWFREGVGPWRWTAVILGFAGTLIVAQPGGEPVEPLGVAAALGAAFLVAVLSHQIRDLGRTESPWSTVFWFSAFGTLMTAPILPFVFTPHTGAQWLLVLSFGLFGAIGQVLMTAALRLGSVTSVIVMDYTALIWTSLWGYAVFDKVPSLATYLGAPLIIAAGIVIAWREHVRNGRAVPDAASGMVGD